MNRIEFLKSIGIGGAVIITAHVNLFKVPSLGEKANDNIDIFFAKHDKKIYLLFRNTDRTFKVARSMSDDEYSDMIDLKCDLVDLLIDHYRE